MHISTRKSLLAQKKPKESPIMNPATAIPRKSSVGSEVITSMDMPLSSIPNAYSIFGFTTLRRKPFIRNVTGIPEYTIS